MTTFDLTPDPKVLIALTHTPMQPLDALCELIDNALDSFQAAELQGSPVKGPLIIVELPRVAEISKGAGLLRVRDNGTGLSLEMAEKALRAGFSSNNQYDSLGLFGMGFNISTGKMGRVTNFLTARADDTSAIGVKIDLEAISNTKNYQVPVDVVAKPSGFVQGTVVEVSSWWPSGNSNSDFIKKLVQYGLPKVREELGRRYSSILREGRVRIVVNGVPIAQFEHCIWDDSRYVERRGVGKVPAVIRFDEIVGSQRRCTSCTALIEEGRNNCQVCGSSGSRTIKERIRGWVGIQRYDDLTDFGIDLIRHGRAIRIGEQAAFFEYTDEFKKIIKDYPIDGPHGRIVGEIHIDHVPVDFLKQDFQRSTPEWQRAMSFVRGDSSLQPNKIGADQNKSPVYTLYQGYRRIRNVGKPDMYMGYWDETAGAAKRISRDIEQEYLKKFRDHIPGYYEDTEWWKLVEQADKKPLEELVECPKCGFQNLKGFDVCQGCNAVLRAKSCISPSCGQTIPLTAAICEFCGTSQRPEVLTQWKCNVCGDSNAPDATKCRGCGSLQGSLNPISRDYLISKSHKSDELSIPECSLRLADESSSTPIDIVTYMVGESIVPVGYNGALPLFVIKTPDRIEVFVDPNHVAFKSLAVRAEHLIAGEVASFVFEYNRNLAQHQGVHALSSLAWQLIQKYWLPALEVDPEKLQRDIRLLLNDIKQKLPIVLKEYSEDIFEDMDAELQRRLVNNLIRNGKELGRLGEIRKSGEYLEYISDAHLIELFKKHPEEFFDGLYWNVPYTQIQGLVAENLDRVQHRIRSLYASCMEDAVYFIEVPSPDPLISRRVKAALDILNSKRD